MPSPLSDLKTPEKTNVKSSDKPVATKSPAKPLSTPNKFRNTSFLPPLTTPVKLNKTPAKLHVTPVKSYKAEVGGVFEEVESLHAAVIKGDCTYIASVGENSPMLFDTANSKGNTSVHIAAISGALESLKQLKTCNANVYIRNKDGRNIAHLAAFNARIDILEEFYAYKGNMNAIATDGFTPAHHAVIGNNIDVIKVLIKCRADFSKKSTLNIDLLKMIINTVHCKNKTIMQALEAFIKKNQQANKNHVSISPYEIALIVNNQPAVKLIAGRIEQQKQTTEKRLLLLSTLSTENINAGKPIIKQGNFLSPLRKKHPGFFALLDASMERAYDENKKPLQVFPIK